MTGTQKNNSRILHTPSQSGQQDTSNSRAAGQGSEPEDEPQVKVLVIGAFNSGKSTLVQNISTDSFSADELGTTVSLDFGTISVDGATVLLFGTPGHDRFNFVREILSVNLKGILLVIDSLYPETFWKALDYIREVNSYIERSCGYRPPFVICANKQDIDGALTPGEVKEEILYDLGENIPVVGTIATTGEGVIDAIRVLLDKISEQGDAIQNQDGPSSDNEG